MLHTSRPGALVGLVVLAFWLAPIPKALGPMGVEAAMAQDAFEPEPDQVPPDEGDEMVGEGQEGELIEGDQPPDFNPAPRPRAPRGKSQRGRSKAAPKRKGGTPKAKAEAPAGTEPGAKAAPGEISFAKQVAPIIAANCAGCHRPGRPGWDRANLDLTTFEKMMRGAGGEPVVLAGKPEESHMVLRVKGEETPRMPQGNDVSLSAEAIGRIERWIKAGAKLDAGLDPKAEIASYAASPEEIERDRLAQMNPDELEGAIETAGRERWTKTNPELKPEITSSDRFVLFGVMPKERATATLKTMEAVVGQLTRAVSPDAAKWPEKISLYVFPDQKDYVEFIRTFKRRDAAPEEAGDADLRTQHPYVVIADPGADDPEAAAPRRGAARGRGAAEAEPQTRRTAAGLLTENLIRSAVLSYGKSPTWLAEGLSLYLAEQVERGGARYQRLRAIAFDAFRQGWATKATEALGGGREMSGEEFRAISFALVECLASPQYQRLFPAMAQGMSEGQEKLDEVVKDVYGVSRDVFLGVTGDWVAGAYGGVR